MPGIYDRVFPLPTNLVRPLASFIPPPPQPEEEEFLGFPAISPAAIEGDGYGVLPYLFGNGRGVHGVVGRGRGRLVGLSGRGRGDVGGDGRGFVRLASIRDEVFQNGIVDGSQGSVSWSGLGSVVISVKGAAVGQQDDEDIAMIALLLAA